MKTHERAKRAKHDAEMKQHLIAIMERMAKDAEVKLANEQDSYRCSDAKKKEPLYL